MYRSFFTFVVLLLPVISLACPAKHNSSVSAVHGNTTVKAVHGNSTVKAVHGNTTVKAVPTNTTVKAVPKNTTVNATPQNTTVNAPEIFTGRGTWFHPDLGNCGEYDTDASEIVAISLARYNSNNGANCNQWLHIVNTANNYTAEALIHDSCPECGWDDLDMSVAVFQQLADLDVGVIEVAWYFVTP